MSDLMIKIEGVKKEYRLGQIGGTTLREELQRINARIRKEDDPTRKIGSKSVASNEKYLALDNINLCVYKGERLGIIGHNGAGKSTLLKLISRITAPSEGIIGLNGRVASMLEVGTGFHPELTGRENIYMNGAILGMTKKEIDSKMDDIIEFSECRRFIDTPVKRYSSGMYVKLAFSVAAHLDSEIMIMDEVLAVGDVAFQNKCIEKMRDVATSGRTILYVSHNMNTIRSLCNRCVVLNKGQIVYEGDVETSIQHYVNSKFEISPYINLEALKRPYLTIQDARLVSATAYNKNTWVYLMGEKMQFELVWKATRLFNNASLRIGVWSVNGYAIGISYSESFSGDSNTINKNTIELDISRLLPGRYYLELILLEIDNNQQAIKQDCIREAIPFEIAVNPDDTLFRSANSSWGFYELPNAAILYS